MSESGENSKKSTKYNNIEKDHHTEQSNRSTKYDNKLEIFFGEKMKNAITLGLNKNLKEDFFDKIKELVVEVNKEVKEDVVEGYKKVKGQSDDIDELFFEENRKIAEKIEKNSQHINVEEMIRVEKRKEIQENKNSLVDKMKMLNEQLRILEVTDSKLDSSNVNVSGINQIEENIKKTRAKEIKKSKREIEERIKNLDTQIREIEEEEVKMQDRSHNAIIRKYLSNFEEDQKRAESKTKQWEKSREERLKVFTDRKNQLEQLAQDIINEREAKEKEKQRNRAENYRNKLEKLKERNDNNHIHLEQVKESLDKAKSTKNKIPLFKKLERLDKRKDREEKEEYENKLYEDKQRRKEHFRSINLDELTDFKRKFEEEKEKLKNQKDKNRTLKLTEIDMANEKLPKQITDLAKKTVEEDQEARKHSEHFKEEKVVMQIKLKNYIKAINTLKPKISEAKKKEMDELKEKVHAKPKKHHRVHKSVFLKKHDPDKPYRDVKWKLKLRDENDSQSKLKRRKSLPNEISKSFNESFQSQSVHSSSGLGVHKISSPKKLKPLDKPIDYLKELRLKKESEGKREYSEGNLSRGGIYQDDQSYEREAEHVKNKWEKALYNEKNSLYENIEGIKMQMKKMEQDVKMKEKVLQHSGGSSSNPDVEKDVSNKIIDLIRAKLTILENIDDPNKLEAHIQQKKTTTRKASVSYK